MNAQPTDGYFWAERQIARPRSERRTRHLYSPRDCAVACCSQALPASDTRFPFSIPHTDDDKFWPCPRCVLVAVRLSIAASPTCPSCKERPITHEVAVGYENFYHHGDARLTRRHLRLWCEKCATDAPVDDIELSERETVIVQRLPTFKCAGAECPGHPYKDKEWAHPPSCLVAGTVVCVRSIKALRNLAAEERMRVFAAFCTHCGSDDPSCQCSHTPRKVEL